MSDLKAMPPDTSKASTSMLLMTLAIAFLPSGSIAAARYVLPTYALSAGASVTIAGSLGGALTVASIFLSKSYGGWIDRIGAKIPALCALVMIALAPLVYFSYMAPWVLIVTAIMAGTGAMFTHLASAKAVGEAGAPSQRSSNLAYLVLSYSLAQFVFPALGGWVFEHVGPDAGLLTIMGPALIAVALVLCTRNNYVSMPRATASDVPKPRYSSLYLWRLRELRLWTLASSTFVAVHSSYPFFMALHAPMVGISPAQGGLVLGGFAAGSFASRLFTPQLVRRFQPPVLILISLVLGGAQFAAIPYITDFNALMMASASLGAALGIGVPVSLGLVYDHAPKGAESAANGLNTALANTFQTVMPLIFGVSTAYLNSLGLLSILVALAMGALAATIALRRA